MYSNLWGHYAGFTSRKAKGSRQQSTSWSAPHGPAAQPPKPSSVLAGTAVHVQYNGMALFHCAETAPCDRTLQPVHAARQLCGSRVLGALVP